MNAVQAILGGIEKPTQAGRGVGVSYKTPAYQRRAYAAYQQRNLALGRCVCTICQKAFRDPFSLRMHLNSSAHTRGPAGLEYACNLCGFKSDCKYNWGEHLKTRRHAQRVIDKKAREQANAELIIDQVLLP